MLAGKTESILFCRTKARQKAEERLDPVPLLSRIVSQRVSTILKGFPLFGGRSTWEAKRGAAFRPAGTRAPVANSSGPSTTSRNAVGRSEWFLHKARASSRSPHFPVQRRDCCGSTRDLRRWCMGLPEIRRRSSHATSLSDRPTAGASASRSTGACGDRRMTRAGVPGPSRSIIPRRYSAE
jgi:hypothetical protein